MAIHWRNARHRSDLNQVPHAQGVYKLYWVVGTGRNCEWSIQYIGQSSNLNMRLHQHLQERWWNYVEYAVTSGWRRHQRLKQEKRLIIRHDPPYNVY